MLTQPAVPTSCQQIKNAASDQESPFVSFLGRFCESGISEKLKSPVRSKHPDSCERAALAQDKPAISAIALNTNSQIQSLFDEMNNHSEVGRENRVNKLSVIQVQSELFTKLILYMGIAGWAQHLLPVPSCPLR
eukprot:g28445.t1